MVLHKTVLAHRRQAIIFNSTAMPSQFTYMWGIAVELAQRKTLGPDVTIYFMTDNSRKELIESTEGIEFLDLGPPEEVQADLSTIMSNARAPPRDARALASISTGFWEQGEVLMNCIHRSYAHLERIRPMLVILDQFSRALDGAMKLRIPYLMCGNETTPTTRPTVPGKLIGTFVIPTVTMGYVAPMTWWEMAANFAALAKYLAIMFTHPLIRAQAARRRRELNEPNLPYATLDRSYAYDLEHGEIWAMPPSILQPGATYSTVYPVGPTFAAQFEGIEKSNLEPWMDEEPLVYINMGTLFKYNDQDIQTFAHSLIELCTPSDIRAVKLVTQDRHRYLWKLPRRSHARLSELVPDFLERTHGRVKIEAWIDFPHAVLEHPNTIAIVHHGGANSFCEAAWFGIPQVIIPQWADCYDTAAQIKRHGLGVVHDGPNVPDITVAQMTELFTSVLAAESHEIIVTAEGPQTGYAHFKERSSAFSDECRTAGGAPKACEVIERFYAAELAEWDGPASEEQEKYRDNVEEVGLKA